MSATVWQRLKRATSLEPSRRRSWREVEGLDSSTPCQVTVPPEAEGEAAEAAAAAGRSGGGGSPRGLLAPCSSASSASSAAREGPPLAPKRHVRGLHVVPGLPHQVDGDRDRSFPRRSGGEARARRGTCRAEIASRNSALAGSRISRAGPSSTVKTPLS